jgi:hypothetical protein
MPRKPSPAVSTPGNRDKVRAARLEVLIARLVAQQTSGRIAYWATFTDEHGMSHYALVVDPAYADLTPDNAASRTGAVAALARAIERYRATLASLHSAR